MDSLGLRATKTVWVFPPEEPSGIPGLPTSITHGVTLADPAYLNYCRTLASRGVEIALHGATAGNNRRELIQRAFAVMDANFPPASTYICHAKNADNPYWQEKVVARGPLALALRLYARGHHCSGENPASPYFWGDLCRQRLLYIRLLRTRRINTLAANPSMPYFEREKPLVPGWFSATEGCSRGGRRRRDTAARAGRVAAPVVRGASSRSRADGARRRQGWHGPHRLWPRSLFAQRGQAVVGGRAWRIGGARIVRASLRAGPRGPAATFARFGHGAHTAVRGAVGDHCARSPIQGPAVGHEPLAQRRDRHAREP